MKLYCITVTVCARDVCREHTHALTLGLCFSELVPHRAINLTHSFATAHPPLMGTPIRTNSFENNHLHSLHTNSHPNSFELCKQKKKCARLLFSFLNVRVRIDCFRVCMYSFSFFSREHVGSFCSLYWRVLRLFALSSGNWAVINRNASELSTFPFPFPVALYHLNSSIQFLLIYPSKS